MGKEYLTMEGLCARWGADTDAVIDRLRRSQVRVLICKDDILALEKALDITPKEDTDK